MVAIIQLILVLGLLQVGLQQWSSYPDIRTGRVQIVSSTLNSMNFRSLDVTYSDPISQTTSCGIGIVKYNADPGNDFSFNVTIVNFLTNMMRITAIALDSTVLNSLSINYIAVGKDTYFLEVQFLCFLPTVLSKGNGTRVETLSRSTLFTTNSLQCQTFLSGFRIQNSQGLLNDLKAAVTCPTATSAINLQFTAKENNTVSLICYTTLIFCEQCTQILYYQWGKMGSYSINSKADVTAISVPGRYEDKDRTFWGLSSIQTSRGISKVFNFQSNYFSNSDPIDTNYEQSISTFSATLSYFFIARRGCDTSSGAEEWFHVSDQTCRDKNSCNSATETLPGDARYCSTCHYTCEQCQGALVTNCTKCSAADFRVFTGGNSCPCLSDYININQTRCIPCSFYMPGCTSCITTSICQTCMSGFSINPSTAACMCNAGFLVTGVCTTIVGCISATNLGGLVSCLDCNGTAYYTETADFKCTCMTGYSYNTVFDCVNVCGDSMLVSAQGCDDGNTINGDGCSSTCQVQTYWSCDNNPKPSICYINSNLTGTIKYVRRILSQNKGQFAIKLSPYFSNFLSMNFSANLTTNMPCLSYTIKYSEDLLKFNCTYSQTLQGNNYYLNITLDPKFYSSNNTFSIQLPASGMNAKLTLDANYALNEPFRVIIIILVSLSLLVMFLTAISERMIGVQLIQTLQSVLYAMTIMKVCPSTLSSLQNLQYSSGYNSVFGTDLTRIYPINFSVSSVGIEQQFLLSYNLFYFINIAIIAIIILLKLLLNYLQSNKKTIQIQNTKRFQMKDIYPWYYKVKAVYKFLFERIIFLLLFSNVFLIMFGTAMQLSYQRPDYTLILSQLNLMMCGLAIFIALIFIVMVAINSIYLKINIFPMFMNKTYPFYYVTYTTIFIVLISFLYAKTGLLYVLTGMTAANLIILSIWAPYPEKIHNITIAFNQGTILLALLVYIMQAQFTKTSQNNQNLLTIALVIIVVCMYVCLILSILRLISYYRYMNLHKLTYDDVSDPKEQNKRSDFERINKDDKGIEMIENDKYVSNYESIKSVAKEKQDYHHDIKASTYKSPLNVPKDGPETNRYEKSFVKNNNKSNNNNANDNNLDDFQTFSKSKGKRKLNSFEIQPIDPNAKQVNVNQIKSPYDYTGDAMKLHNFPKQEEQYDALKAIKQRLRKDFYQKIHGIQDAPNQQNVEYKDKPLLDKSSFLPNDYYQ